MEKRVCKRAVKPRRRFLVEGDFPAYSSEQQTDFESLIPPSSVQGREGGTEVFQGCVEISTGYRRE